MYSASIVLYKTTFSSIQNLINSILNSGKIDLLYLIDNRAIDDEFPLMVDRRIIYEKSNQNIGFGSAHNIAIKQAYKKGTSLHFIINPDITFDDGVINDLIESMNLNPDIGLMMPSILNNDGTPQYLPKLIPSPFSLFARKINSILPLFNKYVINYDMR